MKSSEIPHPLAKVRGVSSETAQGFLGLRHAISGAGPLDPQVGEFILLAGFVTLGFEDAVKIHAARLLESGTSLAAVQQCVLTLFGATATLVQVANALEWIEEISGAPA